MKKLAAVLLCGSLAFAMPAATVAVPVVAAADTAEDPNIFEIVAKTLNLLKDEAFMTELLTKVSDTFSEEEKAELKEILNDLGINDLSELNDLDIFNFTEEQLQPIMDFAKSEILSDSEGLRMLVLEVFDKIGIDPNSLDMEKFVSQVEGMATLFS